MEMAQYAWLEDETKVVSWWCCGVCKGNAVIMHSWKVRKRPVSTPVKAGCKTFRSI